MLHGDIDIKVIRKEKFTVDDMFIILGNKTLAEK